MHHLVLSAPTLNVIFQLHGVPAAAGYTTNKDCLSRRGPTTHVWNACGDVVAGGGLLPPVQYTHGRGAIRCPISVFCHCALRSAPGVPTCVRVCAQLSSARGGGHGMRDGGLRETSFPGRLSSRLPGVSQATIATATGIQPWQVFCLSWRPPVITAEKRNQHSGTLLLPPAPPPSFAASQLAALAASDTDLIAITIFRG